MFRFVVNGVDTALGGPTPDNITSLVVDWNPFIRIPVSAEEKAAIEQWLSTLFHACTAEYIAVNGVLCRLDELPFFCKES